MNVTKQFISSIHESLHVVPGFDAVEAAGASLLRWSRLQVNGACEDLEAWQVVVVSALVLLLAQYIWDFVFLGDDCITKVKKRAFHLVKKIPYVRKRIEAEVAATGRSMNDAFSKDLKPGMSYVRQLPVNGYSATDVCLMAENYITMRKVDLDNGRASGTLYNGGAKLTQLNGEIYRMFAWTNPLHSDVFPDIRKMEAEVVRMCVSMFNGGREACGVMTAGGTESILLACKAYRDRAISRGIKHPQMLVPRSAHAAFEKACQTFNITLRTVPADPVTMKVDVKKMARMINRNTCMLVGSAPDFPVGMIDPIEEISELGLKYDIPVHVDSCLGGFLLPFMEKAGFSLPLFDFRLPGVSSISCDTHKYGFAPKGSSVILYANNKLRRFQYYVITDWPGGIYATPTIGGSRPGAIIAACWATMMYYGEQGYVNTTRQIISTARYIREELKKIDGIFILGDPQVSVVTLGSLDFDIFRLYEALTKRGWNLNALQFPSSFHLCCTLLQTQPGVADEFLDDVRQCTAAIMRDPKEKVSGMAAIYGMSQGIPDRTLVAEMVMEYLDAIYNTDHVASHQNGSAHRH